MLWKIGNVYRVQKVFRILVFILVLFDGVLADELFALSLKCLKHNLVYFIDIFVERTEDASGWLDIFTINGVNNIR